MSKGADVLTDPQFWVLMICVMPMMFVPDMIVRGMKCYSNKELAAISDRYENIKWHFWLWAITLTPFIFLGTWGIFAFQLRRPEFMFSGLLLLVAFIRSYNSVFALFTGVYPVDKNGHSWVYADKDAITKLALKGIFVTFLLAIVGGIAALLVSYLQ